MSFLRRLPTSRLLALCVVVVAVAAGGVAVGSALAGGGPVPPKRSLPRAVHAALAAPAIPGLSGRIAFTNRLVDLSGVEGATPLLAGASGRVWAAPGRRLRLELQSDRGDVLLVSNGRTFTLYDGSARTAYRGQLPPARARDNGRSRETVPTLAAINQGIARFERHASVAGPRPGSLAGRPVYTVRLSPRPRAGLLGAVELAWDATRGVPLRIAVYARGNSQPVLELRATDIGYGAIPASTFSFTPPPGTKVTNVATGTAARARGAHASRTAGKARPITGLAAARRAVPFALRAPTTLQGRRLSDVQVVGRPGRRAALLSYGNDLAGLLVVEHRAGTSTAGGGRGELRLPRVDVGGASGQALTTPLGTFVRFSRGGVEFDVVGLVPRSVALGAARGL